MGNDREFAQCSAGKLDCLGSSGDLAIMRLKLKGKYDAKMATYMASDS